MVFENLKKIEIINLFSTIELCISETKNCNKLISFVELNKYNNKLNPYFIIYLWSKSPKRSCLIQNEVQNKKPKNWRLLLLTSKTKNCHHLDLGRTTQMQRRQTMMMNY